MAHFPARRALLRVLSALLASVCLGTVGVASAGTLYNAVDLYMLEPLPGYTTYGLSDYSPINNLGQATGFVSPGGSSPDHALFWNNSSTPIDLNPTNLTGVSGAVVWSSDGNQQAGTGTVGPTNTTALLWSGTANSAVSLNPANYSASNAFGIGGTQQAGDAVDPTNHVHAALWSGTASSFVDLHPAQFSGFVSSVAYATDGAHQVGFMDNASNVNPPVRHAVMWSGSAASAIDLSPFGTTNAIAWGVDGGEEVGFYTVNTGAAARQHAVFWTGTAASAVDLNPAFLGTATFSEAWSTNGIEQVGDGYGSATNGQYHALAWFGSADSVIDLQTLLPAGFTSSQARSIDSSGNVFGTATDASGNTHAIEWVAMVPEPSSLFSVSALIAARLLARRNRLVLD